jgi:Sulfotransferase domain
MIITDPKSPKGIVWIASYPKSGNTWMRVYLHELMRIMRGLPQAENELHELDKSSTYEARLFGLFEEFLHKPLASATPAEVNAVRPKVQAAIVERASGIALVKTHNVMGQIAGTPVIDLRVSAGTIYIVRDPRDIAVSLADQLGGSIDKAIDIMATSAFRTANTAEAAYEIWGSWSEHTYGWTVRPHEAVIVVRYEDMADKAEETFSAVAAHLGQEPTIEQIKEAIALSSFDKMRELELASDFRERPDTAERFFREGKAGAWRDKMTPQQAQRVVDEHGEQMQKFGYLNAN